ncbi:MAG: lipopolysaccharide biosynthesis protein [Pseudonocardiales bacterium]|nr:MAG: lipopolysaccharide biosynthesis protein [Pseudonocardiales bacterium]
MSDHIRVLWLVKGLYPGGAERLLVSMARVADRSRFDYEVAYLLPSQDGLVPALAALDVPAHCLAGANEYDLGWAVRLRRLLVAGSYDILHGHSPYTSGVARLVVQTLPHSRRPALVSTEHGLWSKYVLPTRVLNALTYGLDRHHFVVSDAVRREVWGVYRDRAELLVQGIVTDDIPPLTPTTMIRTELGLGADEVLLATVANMRPEKDYPRLLRAMRMLLDDGHPVRLAAAGGGPLFQQIVELRDELDLGGKVHLLGHREDVFQLLRECDIFVLSSRFEAYPVALMEAMACGCAIVATAVGGVPDVVKPGIDGILVDGKRPRDLADSIASLVPDPERRSRLSRAARERAAAFDIVRPTSRVQEVYAGLVRAGSAR